MKHKCWLAYCRPIFCFQSEGGIRDLYVTGVQTCALPIFVERAELVNVWPILQDVHQLRALYDRRAGTFLSNAGVLQVFGVNDHDTARLVSDLLGQETVVFQTMAHALDSDRSGITHSQHHTGRSLLTPDEVRNLPRHAQLLFLSGQ